MTDNIITTAEQTTQPQSDMPAQDELTPFEKKIQKRKHDWKIFTPILFPLGYVIVRQLPKTDIVMCISFCIFLLITLYTLIEYLFRCKYLLKFYKLYLFFFWFFAIFVSPLLTIYVFTYNIGFYALLIGFCFFAVFAFSLSFLKRFPCDRNGYFHKPTKKEE